MIVNLYSSPFNSVRFSFIPGPLAQSSLQFSLFLEDQFSLSIVATLFPVIMLPSLGIQTSLVLLAFCHLVGMMLAILVIEVHQVLGPFTMFTRALLAQKLIYFEAPILGSEEKLTPLVCLLYSQHSITILLHF